MAKRRTRGGIEHGGGDLVDLGVAGPGGECLIRSGAQKAVADCGSTGRSNGATMPIRQRPMRFRQFIERLPLRTEASQLLPLFRSEGQGRLLARIYLEPDRPAPISQLAREVELDAGGLTREATRLERAGLIRSQRIGRQRLLHPRTESVYYADLYALLLKAFGPASIIGPALAPLPGIEQALIFGSWAARYLGEPGAQPGDVDVLVIGQPQRRSVTRVTTALTERLGREVSATIVSPERWKAGADGFLRQVKRGPVVQLDIRRRET